MNQSLYDDEAEDDNEDDYIPAELSPEVKKYLQHLQDQETWSDVKWLICDFLKK